jgi:transcription elongation factor Elf1
MKILQCVKKAPFSYCRQCGQDAMVSKTYTVDSQIRRVAFCTNKGCGFRLEIDGYSKAKPVDYMEEQFDAFND